MNPERNPRLEAVTAILLVIAILLCTSGPGGLPELIGQRITAMSHGSRKRLSFLSEIVPKL